MFDKPDSTYNLPSKNFQNLFDHVFQLSFHLFMIMTAFQQDNVGISLFRTTYSESVFHRASWIKVGWLIWALFLCLYYRSILMHEITLLWTEGRYQIHISYPTKFFRPVWLLYFENAIVRKFSFIWLNIVLSLSIFWEGNTLIF